MKTKRFSRVARALLAVVSLLASAALWTGPAAEAQSTPAAAYPNADLLVDATWLAQHLDDPAVRIIDMRPHDVYALAHIPGAANVLAGDIVSTIDNVPAMFDAAKVQATLGSLGLTPQMTAVIYDDTGMMDAARMFWTLDYAGHPDARLLDGGWNAWMQAQLPTTTAVPSFPKTDYALRQNPAHLATWQYVLAHLDDSHVVLVDSRSAAEYTGQVKRAARGGHIPGAVNLDWLESLTRAQGIDSGTPNWQAGLDRPGAGLFKPPAEIEALLASRGITRDKEVITYCQTLWRGAHVYFLLRLMGFTDVRGYDGSWVEWGNRTDLPFVTGPQPGSLKTATKGP